MTDNGKNTPHMEDFEGQLLQWADQRIVSQEDIRAWYSFLVYIVNLSEHDGWVYRGHSFKVKTPMSLLVVRGTIDGLPHVVFTSNRTATGCIRAFLRKMAEGWLEWSIDRFG